MKVDLAKILILVGIAFLIFTQLTNSCGEDPAVKLIEQKFEENKAQIAKINQDYKSLMDSVSQLRKQRVQTNNYYKYEITKIDSIYASGNVNYDVVDSILLFWTNRIYDIPGFFSFEPEPADTQTTKQDSTGSGEILLRHSELQKRSGQFNNSSW